MKIRLCYCGKCQIPILTCTQWDCSGAQRDAHGVSHDYDCETCENKVKAFKAKLFKSKKDDSLGMEGKS